MSRAGKSNQKRGGENAVPMQHRNTYWQDAMEKFTMSSYQRKLNAVAPSGPSGKSHFFSGKSQKQYPLDLLPA